MSESFILHELNQQKSFSPHDHHQYKEQAFIRSLLYHPRVLSGYCNLKKKLELPIEDTAMKRNLEGKYLIDAYTPTELVKRLNGPELHSFQKIYSRLNISINTFAFVLMGLGIFEYNPEHVVYFVKGLIELHSMLLRFKTRQISSKKGLAPSSGINFEDFVAYFLKFQTLLDSNSLSFDDPLRQHISKRFTASNTIYDSQNHARPVKLVHFDPVRKNIFAMDEASSFIRVYNSNGQLLQKLTTNKEKHAFDNMIINHFAWSIKENKLCLCCQDLTISFFEWNKKGFTNEIIYPTQILQARVWYVEDHCLWLFANILDEVSVWNEEKKELEKLDLVLDGNLSDVVALKNLSLMAFAAFNKKIVFWSNRFKSKLMEISLTDTSAHTLRYYPEQSILYVATFGQIAKAYQIDKSKDFTVIGKLDHPVAVSSMELIAEKEILLTGDESGLVKAWDIKTHKCVQTFKFNSNKSITQIKFLSSASMFVCVTNRLQFFHFGEKDHSKFQNIQIASNVVFDKNNQEIVIGTPYDLRTFNLHYGTLTSYFEREEKNDMIEGFFKRSRDGSLCYYTETGKIWRVSGAAENSKDALRKLQPFSGTEMNFTYFMQRYQLLVCSSKTVVKIYKYEDNGQCTLLRTVSLPEKYSISSVSYNIQANYLVLVLNYKFALFLEFQKCHVVGCYANYDPPPVEKDYGPSPLVSPTGNSKEAWFKTKKVRKFSFSSASIKMMNVAGKDPGQNSRGSFRVKTDESPTSMKESSMRGSSPKSSKGVANLSLSNMQIPDAVCGDNFNLSTFEAQSGSIANFVYLKNHNCCLVVDYDNQVTLFEPSDLPQIKNKIKLVWDTQPTKEMQLTVVKYKRVLHKANGSDQESPMEVKRSEYSLKISNFGLQRRSGFIEDDGLFSPGKGKHDQDYMLFGDSSGRVTIMNLTELLAQNFSTVSPHTPQHIYYNCEMAVKNKDIDDSIESAWNCYQRKSDSAEVVRLNETNHRSWQAHKGEILTLKIISFRNDVIVSIGTDLYLRIWNLRTEKLCELSLATMRCNQWNLVDFSLEEKIQDLSNVTAFISELEHNHPDLHERIEEHKNQLAEGRKTSNHIFSKKVSFERERYHRAPVALERSRDQHFQSAPNIENFEVNLTKSPSVLLKEQTFVLTAPVNLRHKSKKDHGRRESEEHRKILEEKGQLEQAIFNSLVEQSRRAQTDKNPILERTKEFEKKLDSIAELNPHPKKMEKHPPLLQENSLTLVQARSHRKNVASSLALPINKSPSKLHKVPQTQLSRNQSLIQKRMKKILVPSAEDSSNTISVLEKDLSNDQVLKTQAAEQPFSLNVKEDNRSHSSLVLPSITSTRERQLKNSSFRRYLMDSIDGSFLSGVQNPNDSSITSDMTKIGPSELQSGRCRRKHANNDGDLPAKTSSKNALTLESEGLRRSKDNLHSILKHLDSRRKHFQNINSSVQLSKSHRVLNQINEISRRVESGNIPNLKSLNSISRDLSPKSFSKEYLNTSSHGMIADSNRLYDEIQEDAQGSKITQNSNEPLKNKPELLPKRSSKCATKI